MYSCRVYVSVYVRIYVIYNENDINYNNETEL